MKRRSQKHNLASKEKLNLKTGELTIPDYDGHKPVMVNEVMHYLAPHDGGVYLDATFGRGGYSRALLDQCHGKVIGLDRDPDALIMADEMALQYGDRFSFICGCFSQINERLQDLKHSMPSFQGLDGVMFDLGVSSPQFDKAERGFSFQKEARLDMRMGAGGMSAYELVNHAKEEELARIFYEYGEERSSRPIARAIASARKIKPIATTSELRALIHEFYQGKGGVAKIDPATRCFQALRIAVNDELNELKKGLEQCLAWLKQGARLVVVSYHSLEDRIAKQFFRDYDEKEMKRQIHYANQPFMGSASMEQTLPKWGDIAFRPLHKRIITPLEQEIRLNKRARSAKLRAGELVRLTQEIR